MTPLPMPGHERLDHPDRGEVQALTDGVLSAIRPGAQPTEFQQLLIGAAFEALTGHRSDTSSRPTPTAEEFAVGLADRNEPFRSRILQTMLLGALVLRPLPEAVAN